MADPPDGQRPGHLAGLEVPADRRDPPADRRRTTVRGQYEGYTGVDGVDPHSTVETFVAVRLAVDSWRWAGVPVLIRAGKCLPVTATEVTVRFQRAPYDVFGLNPLPDNNTLRFRVWPETAVGDHAWRARSPGPAGSRETEELTFAERPGADMRPYDRLIGAALDGDRWLFARQDTVEAAWRVVDPVLGDAVPVHPYAKGTWGPKEADRLLPGPGRVARPGRVRPAGHRPRGRAAAAE